MGGAYDSTTSTAASFSCASSSESETVPIVIRAADGKLDRTRANARKMLLEMSDEPGFCYGGLRVCWPVDAHKLRSSDTQIVSPSFDILPGVGCKLILKALSTGDKKGQACFRRARGRGFVQLKCHADGSVNLSTLSFRVSLGADDGSQAPREPVTHDFSDTSVWNMPKDEQWDFRSAVDPVSMTFLVRLEIAPQH